MAFVEAGVTGKVTDRKAAVEERSAANVGGETGGHSEEVARQRRIDQLFDESQVETAVAEVVGEVLHVGKTAVVPSDDFEAALSEMDREIVARAAQNVSAALRWAEVDIEQPEPHPDWVRQYGPEKARILHRIAVMGNVPKNKMPAGMYVAQQVFVGFMKARSEKVEKPQLNLTLVHIETKDHKYPEKVLGEKT